MVLDTVPAPIKLSTHAFDAQFHPDPEAGALATCHVSGRVALWKLDTVSNKFRRTVLLKHHARSCRCICFFDDGQKMVTGSSDRLCVVVDVLGNVLWKSAFEGSNAHAEAVNVVRVLNDHLVASGDDEGCLKIWDIRAPPETPCITFQESDDFISDIEYSADRHPEYLLATFGDALGQFDIRVPRLEALSDPQEGDLLCCRIVRNGTKVICGTGHDGCMSLFSWGNFGDLDDRLTGHGVSVDRIIPYPTALEQEVVLTAAGDGLIRVVSLFPNKVIGSLGMHADDESGVEILALNPSNTVLVSGGHDNFLRFHSTEDVNAMIHRFFKSGQHSQTASSANDFFSDM